LEFNVPFQHKYGDIRDDYEICKKNLLIFEFSPGAHIKYTALKKLPWQLATMVTTTGVFTNS